MLLTQLLMSIGNAQVGMLLVYVAYLYLVALACVRAGTTGAEDCIGGFDIHRDKIIRTEESTAMGAQFLDESELPSRAQCLELCCEMQKCDVFVYEEKNPGSCYMFHCGPADDFRCKFSRHANYSSAVLTTPREQLKQMVEQQQKKLQEAQKQLLQQEQGHQRLSQHEQELANLRARVIPNEYRHTSTKAPAVAKSPHATTTSPKSPNVAPTMLVQQKCSTYQFACHSGECIAVYNACDGIPQCIDGSDEAAELQCPPLQTPAAPAPPRKQNLLQAAPQIIAARPIIPLAAYDKPVPLSNIYSPVELNVPDLKELQARPNNWVPRQSNEQYDSDSRLYGHKGGFQLIASQFVDPQADLEHPANSYREQPEVYRNHAGDVWQLEHLQQKESAQQQNGWLARQQPVLIPTLRELPNKQQQTQWRQEWSAQQPGNDMTATITAKKEPHHMSSIKSIPKSSTLQTTSKPEQQEYSDEEALEETSLPPKSSAKKVKHKHHTNDQNENEKDKLKENSHPMHEHLKMYDVRDGTDGEAEKPGGAVLSLTLGVCITAALAVLVGCRLRSVKRRVRRHGKSGHAHDPDYLVNGMYL